MMNIDFMFQVLTNQLVIFCALESILENGSRKEEIKDLIETASDKTVKLLGVTVDENKNS